MLLRLYVKNYAIIDELEIRFSGNLNVITGETGAGKSILLGALSLILGQRAETDMLRQPDAKAVIEGVFRLPDTPSTRSFFEQNELDRDSETLIRREISPSGKSRAFINDTPVTLQQLSRLGSLLVDLHQQFDTLALHRSDFQLEVLDALADNGELLKQYRQKYAAFTAVQKELETLVEENARLTREADYDRFLFEELETAAFTENELEKLETERQALAHSEDVKAALAGAVDLLEDSEQALVPALRRIEGLLRDIAAFHEAVPELLTRISSCQIELQDISSELQRVQDHGDGDTERAEFIAERLDAGYKLMKKHAVRSTAELLAIRQELQEKLDRMQDAGDAIARLEKQKQALLKEAQVLAASLSAARKKQLPPFMKKTNALLATVGMPNAALQVRMSPGQLAAQGQDEVTFAFDANKSGNFQPLGKVASGGELSRLMLCIKSLVARSVSLPTLIFDEIDSGISGEAARQVGGIMQELAQAHQVICITHQPQIAGKGHTHFFVYKEEESGHILTRIRILSAEERVEAIARMLSGEKPGKAALANARELLQD
jgi:DNA repair protein RecN (Recombination protein N)